MTRHCCLGIVCVALVTLWVDGRLGASQAAAQAGQQAASAAVSANPELTGALSKEIGGTPEQAAGAAGALFGLAKSRLKPEDFSKIAAAVPGMDSLLKAVPGAAPAANGTRGGAAVGTTGATGAAAGALGSLGSSAAGLPAVAGVFSKLGLAPDMVAKAVPALTSYVTKTGGADVGDLLAGVLK